MDAKPAAAPLFTAARRFRSSDDVVAQVREAMHQGWLVPGDRLPSERELCGAFGVGRSTLREGLRILESSGVVEIRPGAAGGIFVTNPDERQLASAFESLVRFGGATDREIVEFGISLLSETAYWAAVRADERDLGAIAAALRGLEDLARARGSGTGVPVALHAAVVEAIARASKNSVRVALVLGIHGSLLGQRLGGPLDAAVTELTAVTAALRERNARVGRVRMRRHLQRLVRVEEGAP